MGYFRTEFVERKKWLDDRTYADVVALAQFLPGPASSQAGMAVGYHRAGWLGMLWSWFLFIMPSALVLAFFGLFIGTGSDVAGSGWGAGLLAAAVDVVFHAVLVFLPSFLLMTAGLHFWNRFDFLRPAFKGVNAVAGWILL